MTDTPNLPARPTFGTLGQEPTALSDAPTAALAFALGYAVARPQHANTFGPFCAMVEELMARPARVTADGWAGTTASVWDQLMATLPAPVARNIGMLYQAQRGQRWAATGRRHGTNPSNTGNS